MPSAGFSILLFVVVQLLTPAIFFYSVWRGRDETRSLWLLKVGTAGAYVALMWLTGRWDSLSYYLRAVLPVLFLAATAAGYWRTRHDPWTRDGRIGSRSGALGSIIAFVGVLVATLVAARGHIHPSDAIDLEPPLRHGTFYVGQGGNSRLLNNHSVSRAQRYATDIVQLNAFGARASSLMPSSLSSYVIFGAPVFSPCSGVVAEAMDGRPDSEGAQVDTEHPAGNHVVIACHGVRITLAHFRRSSLEVTGGERVESGQRVAAVGNSGNTSEPHLHVHAEREAPQSRAGEGAPVTFRGRAPARNMLLRW